MKDEARGDRLRASDADRDAAAAALRGHFAAGRLDSEEAQERIVTALEARTMGEVRAVLADLPDQRPEPGRAGLERRYRRLLAFYPAAWRRGHGSEMVAVLMAAASAGRTRPALGEAANLIAGGLQVRCQRTRDGGEPAWRDALAVLTVVLPLVVLITNVVYEAWWIHHFGTRYLNVSADVAGQLTIPLSLAGIALLRHYRAAAVIVAAATIGLAAVAGWTDVRLEFNQLNPYALLALAVQVAAVAASPGPRRGLALLTWRGVALTIVAAAAITVATYPLSLYIVVVIVAAMALSSSLGRWLLALLAVPLYDYLTTYSYASIGKIALRLNVRPIKGLNSTVQAVTSWQGEYYLIPAVLLCLFAAAAIRDSRRPRHLGGPSD